MINCCQCGARIFLTERTYEGVEYVEVTEVQTSGPPVVFDQFPPGDAGLGYACSMECFEKHIDDRVHA